MAPITTLLWDIGGVFLTNGWDIDARQRLADQFHFDFEAFEERHHPLVDDFETGRIGEDEYWNRTALAIAPHGGFGLPELRAFMRAQSRPLPDSLAFVRRLAARGRYQLVMLNNESRELNEYRIGQFRLRDYFSVFCSSCYLGLRKPGPAIYDRALQILQREPERCVFTDDRPENLEYPRQRGWHAIRFQGVERLRRELRAVDVDLDAIA